MELRQLEYFVTVVDQASFTRAAEELHVAQPGVSAQIRQLEREFGQQLLDRSGRTVRPTQAGEAVLRYAREALGAADGARHAVDELSGMVRGRVAVGMVVACSSIDLADLLAEYHRDHPGVEISLSEADSAELIDRLLTGRLDMAFIGLGMIDPPGLELQVIADEPIVAGVGKTDALATQHRIELEALLERSLISLPRGTGLRSCLDDACARAGLKPRISLEGTNLRILAQLAARGLGVAILPESVALSQGDNLHAIAIDPPLRGRVALAWRSEGPVSPAARALIGRARKGLNVPASPAGRDQEPAA
jgi:DNA-binding transcriptional LysR family regulator